MRLPSSRLANLFVVAALTGLAACSRSDDKASAPTPAPPEAAPVSGAPQTLKPGAWKIVTQTPAGEESSIQCVPEGYDPGAEAARKATPCGSPTLTRTADGFRLNQTCEKNSIKYELSGVVTGDFATTATTDLSLTLSAYGRKQTMRVQAVSTYQGPCQPEKGR